MLVYAYDHGGATTAGLVAFGQLVPAGLFAPLVVRRSPTGSPRRGSWRAATLVAGARRSARRPRRSLADGPPLLAYALAAAAAPP